MLYRIITENVKRGEVIQIVSDKYDSFTVIDSTGYWKGTAEGSLIIEIDAENDRENDLKIQSIAQRIKKLNRQECVMIQKIKSEVSFI